MTAPTQAQIEAAAEKICRGCYSGVDYRTLDTKTKASWNEIAEAALTAAAQVEPTEYTQGYRHGFAGIQDEVRATVERCAQVAETLVFNEYGKNRQEIAAAIRKLRDEP